MAIKKRKELRTYKKKINRKVKKTKKTASYKTSAVDYLSSLKVFMKMLLSAPYLFINNLSKNILLGLKVIFLFVITLFKIFVKLLNNFKEATFGILFGLLSGSIASVVIYSYYDLGTNSNLEINELYKEENLKLKRELKELNSKILETNKKLEESLVVRSELKDLATEVLKMESNISGVKQSSDINLQNFESLLKKSDLNKSDLEKLQKKVDDNSKLMLSSSKSELSNRLYLAQSLVDRLRSGVPYAPQLVALGKEGLHPALLRYAKGGAPTISDLAARLSVRAGELRDADKTKRDSSWRENLKLSKLIKVRPIDIEKIEGTPGALLRAEDAISKGNLLEAIEEIDSLRPEDRGVLNAWLSEAKAKRNASVAAENLLAKTTAALRTKN